MAARNTNQGGLEMSNQEIWTTFKPEVTHDIHVRESEFCLGAIHTPITIWAGLTEVCHIYAPGEFHTKDQVRRYLTDEYGSTRAPIINSARIVGLARVDW